MDLIIFDIDGTLLHSTAIDDACFVRAAEDVFGVRGITDDWSAYEHCTDVAIASQIVRERLSRCCTRSDLASFRARFVELLTDAHRRDADVFRRIPGASDFLAHLHESGAAACLATGGFEASARFKLASASLDCLDLPAAFAEDGPSREQIVTRAIERAATRARSAGAQHDDAFRRTISVGDGVWDVRAAASLGIPFIGIGTGERAAALHAAGALLVLPDYADLSRVLEAVEQAEVPRIA